MFLMSDDEMIVDERGRIVYFSADRFITDIVEGGACFICGARRDAVEFNDEHVLPNWILKRYKLHNESINLPNGAGHKYGSYKIPCCKSCNSLMSDIYEVPISKVTASGYEPFVDFLAENPWKVFTWLSLIFVKAHLRDNMLRLNLDARKGNEPLSQLYAWEDLHHVHCMARSFYSGVELEPSAFGSMIVLPASTAEQWMPFDFKDVYRSQTMLLRMDEIAIFVVFNDACAVMNIVNPVISKVTGKPAPFQLREIFAHLVYGNQLLETRPVFSTQFRSDPERLVIASDCPKPVTIGDFDAERFGFINYSCNEDLFGIYGASNDQCESISKGTATTLFRDDGNFIDFDAAN